MYQEFGGSWYAQVMYERALRHFQKHDPQLFVVAQKIVPFELTTTEDYFADLCDAIVSQQLSGKASKTIFSRFCALFDQGKIDPYKLFGLDETTLRGVGISNAKAKYLKNLAEHVIEQKVNLQELSELTDEEIITALTQVKGIGRWTAEMFLMFTLARPDVFSAADLGLKNGIKKVYGLSDDPTPKEMIALSEKWSPYRTYASRILWKSLELPIE